MLKGSGSRSASRLLRTQVGGIRIGAAVEATVESAVFEATSTLRALNLEDQSYKLRSTGIFNKKPIEWTAPNGTQQTYKIHQRTDIDWNRVRTSGREKFIGRTNAEAAKAGLAPQLRDGSFATLHHINQNSVGKLVEASSRYHGDFRAPGQKILHGIWGRNKPHPENPVNHTSFKLETEAYWKWRIDQ